METTEAYDFALAETTQRLRALRPYYGHDPYCDCENPSECLKTVKMIEPTEYCLQPMRDFRQAYAENFRKLLKTKMKYSQTKTTTPLTWCFITINPKPNVELSLFMKKLNQFVKTKIFADYIAVVEQRGLATEALGKGFHAHILFKRHTPLNEGLPPTNIKRNVKQSWKRYCEVSNPHILNIQFVGDDFAVDKYEYIMGTKTAEGKKDKQLGDVVWRQENNIPEYLGNKNLIK